MILLDISLCLPELDIIALREKRSIVAVTRRFIVPDRSFALLPCRAASESVDSTYHPKSLTDLKDKMVPSSEPLRATHWARCVFCQQVDEAAITRLSDLTIWTSDALSERFQNNSLFLSFLRAYALPESIAVESEPVCEQIYKFIPLSNYLEVRAESPVYSDEEFVAAKQEVLEPKESEPELPPDNDIETEHVESESILDAPDWIEKISEVGNSSNGYDFEKLVRKGLLALGFTNSLDQSTASLDPETTGGAGGLDFYADQPFSVVGECKATARKSVGDPATQLHKLGLKWLTEEDYSRSMKLILAAGAITSDADRIAVGHHMNVIRPETFQELVALKMKYEKLFNPSNLENALNASPFGEAADRKLSLFVQRWKNAFEKQEADSIAFEKSQQQYKQIVQTVKELLRQSIHQNRKSFSVVEVRSHYNAKYQPCLSDEAVKNALVGLTSPAAAGCLKKLSSPDNQDTYAFVKDMS